jgi:hypothetical protein
MQGLRVVIVLATTAFHNGAHPRGTSRGLAVRDEEHSVSNNGEFSECLTATAASRARRALERVDDVVAAVERNHVFWTSLIRQE